jgi:hypothetical protein
MATNPVPPAVPQKPADTLDEHTGVYGFFRRHQKKLLYTAGLFTLLTFSITGPMLQLVDELFSPTPPMPTIQVGAARVSLAPDDYKYGEILARNAGMGGPLRAVLPPLTPGEGGQSALSNNLAILRRAAITEGLDVSMAEVDRAIETQKKADNVESSVQLAMLKGFPSLAEYREILREAMLVGNYVRLQTLALDGSDAMVIERILADREKITFRTAIFDEKAEEQRLKAAGSLTEEELRKWVDAKSDQEKFRIQAFDSNRLELRFGALLLADGQFDPAQWTDVLKDFAPGDDELQANYEREKANRFKVGDTDTYTPFEEAKPALLRLLQADRVMSDVLQKINERLKEALKPPSDALQRDQEELANAERLFKEAQQKAADAPNDAALQEEKRKAEEVIPAKRAAMEASTAAIKDARAGWDFSAAFTELTKDKSGVVLKAMSGRRSIEDLKDLDAGDLGLGQWATPTQAQGVSSKGDLTFIPIRTSKAVTLFQVTDIELRPLKSWDKLKPLAEDAWYAEQAKQKGEAQKKVLEEALLRLAKAKMADKVAELEGKKTARVDEKLAEWERATQASIAEAEKTLATREPGTQAHTAWQKKLDALRTELEGKEGKRAVVALEVGKAIESEIADEAKKHHREVIDAAAAEAGFTVTDHGPYLRELSRMPRFDKAYDPTVVFLFRSHSELKEGESTGVLQDPTNRRWCFAVCTKVEPMAVQDITRRDYVSLRTGDGFAAFSTQQAFQAYDQAFTQDALHKRYAFQQPVGSQVVDKPPADKK